MPSTSLRSRLSFLDTQGEWSLQRNLVLKLCKALWICGHLQCVRRTRKVSSKTTLRGSKIFSISKVRLDKLRYYNLAEDLLQLPAMPRLLNVKSDAINNRSCAMRSICISIYSVVCYEKRESQSWLEDRGLVNNQCHSSEGTQTVKWKSARERAVSDE